ncbi:MAG: FAD-binding protein [Saprospiraceae bacterium]|nr:FAD-binding protein [Saprospiraceae bacterium]
MNHPSQLPFQELKNQLAGELHTDALHVGIYATDASNYQILPLAVALPKNEADVLAILRWSNLHKVPVMARGGGTSLVGQTVARAIVIDFTKYMDSILEFNPEERWAWVEPGIVRDVLNQNLSAYQLHFAPDPATTSRATVGGMIANNSSGTRSIRYGKTLDHVIELKIALANGNIIQCKNLTTAELEEKLELQDEEGHIYRELFKLIQENRPEIEARFPKVMRRVGGYNLDEFLNNEWNLCDLITGSECTLALILAAKINLEPTPKHQCLCVVHFEDFFESIAHVSEIVAFKPAAVELLDHMLIERSRENLETKHYCHFIQGDPGGVLVVEFYGETQEEAIEHANALAKHLQNQQKGYAWPVISNKQEIEAVFTVRKKGLGLLMGVKGHRKPIAFIEDAAVPLEHLSDYIREVFEVCKFNQTPVLAYAHASVGLLHVKPLLDLRDGEDIERMKKISSQVLQLVKKYKGSWSGEHGDGLARSPYNEEFFGNQLYRAFQTVKAVFDPMNLLNPGKIVDAPAVDSNLRYGTTYKDIAFQSMFHYRNEGGFADAVHLCNGVGECRKHTGGTMCPSFRATLEEKDSTRGRANVLRLAMSGQLDDYGMDSPALQEALDLCLSCKACKSECPSNVDMAKLKSEILHFQLNKKGLSISDRLIAWQDFFGNMNSGLMAGMVNGTMKLKPFRKLLQKISGLDQRRILPEYTLKPFKARSTSTTSNPYNKVVLFADTYMKFHEPGIGISAKKLLEQFGYEVIVYDKQCCQRPAISHGLLDQAKTKGSQLFNDLKPWLDQKIPVLVCEPSCASALKDDIPDLMDSEWARDASERIYLIEDFISREDKMLSHLKFKEGDYLFHGHCHQKAMFTTKSMHLLFYNHAFSEINSGCCGMAGSFGYEKNHYDLSERIAKTSLIPAIEKSKPETHLIANGFSCRHQIEHFGNRKSRHWLEYLEL